MGYCMEIDEMERKRQRKAEDGNHESGKVSISSDLEKSCHM